MSARRQNHETKVRRSGGRLRRILQTAGLVAGSLVIGLFALELGVRILLPQQLIDLRPDVWVPHDGLGWRLAPELDAVVNTGERPVLIVTDEHGFRVGPEWRARPTPARRVLALGDSFLEAVQVPYEDTLGARLEQILSRDLGESVRVVNTGVAGWGPNQYRIQARLELARARYDAVVIFLFAGNDVVIARRDHFGPRPSRQRRGLRWPRALDRGELVDAVAYPVNDSLEKRSHLFVLLKNRGKFLLMRLGLSQHYFPDTLSTASRDRPVWELTADVAREIADEAARYDLPALFVLLPGLYQVDLEASRGYVESLGIDPETVDLDQPARLLGPLFAAHGLELIDATPALRDAHRAGVRELYGHVDTHLGPEGHRVVAERIAPRLVALMR